MVGWLTIEKDRVWQVPEKDRASRQFSGDSIQPLTTTSALLMRKRASLLAASP
jgi:hypothetical protein